MGGVDLFKLPFEQAAARLKQLEHHPLHGFFETGRTAIQLKGLLFSRLNRLSQAVETWRPITEAIAAGDVTSFMDPAGFWSAYSEACLKSGADYDAKIAYRRLAEYPGREYEAAINLGVVFFAEKAYVKAEVCFRKALEFRPGDTNAQKNLEQIP